MLIQISGGCSGGGINSIESHFKADLLHEFDPSISLDNLKEGTVAGTGVRRSSAMPPETYAHRQPSSATVKLTAKMVCCCTFSVYARMQVELCLHYFNTWGISHLFNLLYFI